MRRWRPWEIEYLHRHCMDGASRIARKLQRSRHAVEQQASRYGLTLRRTWTCPKCGREVYTPLSPRHGWCRECSIKESHDTAAIKNREIRQAIQDEKARIERAKRARQAIYSDSDRRKTELCKLREKREVNGKSENENEKE